MSTPDFSALVARHRTYFRTGATRSADWCEGQLIAPRAMMPTRRKGQEPSSFRPLTLTRTPTGARRPCGRFHRRRVLSRNA